MKSYSNPFNPYYPFYLILGLVILLFLAGAAAADMYVTESGWVGIGTDSPGALFEINRAVDPSVGCTTLRISNPSSDPWRAGETAAGIEFKK